MLRYLLYSLRVRRVEYRVAEVPILLIPVFLTIDDAAVFTTLAFWEGVLIFFFLFTVGDLVNCLADRDLDAVYKPHLTEAVYGLGVGHVTFQAVASSAAALVLAAHLARELDRWVLLPGTAFGLLLAASYSLPPVRLKGRGLLQVAFFWLGLFALPMVFAALVVSPSPPLGVYLFAAAYGLLQTGVVLVNTAEDYPEDLEAGVRTVIVALGLRRGITFALLLILAGAAWGVATLAALYHQRGLPPVAFAALAPFVAACAYAGLSVWGLRRRMDGKDLAECVRLVKESARRVPVWITAVALSALAAAFVFFLLGPAEGRPTP